MPMLRIFGCALLFSVLWSAGPLSAQAVTVVFSEPGFPTADTAPPSESALRAGLRHAEFVGAADLAGALARPTTNLLVLPYGSAYPEAVWPALLAYLERGGNLIVLGGKPFTRGAYQSGGKWQLRGPSVAASLELFIHDYQQTPGSQGLSFEPNRDLTPQLPQFAWERAYSPVIRLSVIPTSTDNGATGAEDADLTTLAWGTKAGRRLAAPAYVIDHHRLRFVGGRWIFLSCALESGAGDAAQLLSTLQLLATRKHDRFTLRPRVPLILPGEPIVMRYEPTDPVEDPQPGDQLSVRVTAESDAAPVTMTADAGATHEFTLPADAAHGRGLHTVEATLLRNGAPLSTYRSGFWMRDWQYLLSGPKLTVGTDYFELNGKPLPVVGTTYMAGDVARLYLQKPNAYVWDRDMAQIRDHGLNMIRTGIWTGWEHVLAPDGEVSEDALRAIEAFLMSARHYEIPVQFNLFAFLPNSLGGENAYLDPAALQAQTLYVKSLADRFHALPFLAWDLVNEPSANANLWKTLPDGDPWEQAAWRTWLAERYPDRAALLDAWSEPSLGVGRMLQRQPVATPPTLAAADPLTLPEAGAFEPDGVRGGYNPLKVYDYFLFTQSIFVNWVKEMRAVLHAAGSQQLVTVGQDEGGVAGRLSPAFYEPFIDFTADHTWWDYDAILWASLAAKFPGKPMLIQETGEQRRLEQDDHLRFSPEEEGWQLERKIAVAFAQGAGALEWVWNVNAYMANDNEIPIGAVRPDGTEKPEAEVLAGFAAFAAKHPESFTHIVPPAVTLVTSQALQYSDLYTLAMSGTQHALRALAYNDHTPVRMLPENRFGDLGQPRLVILPSAQALSNTGWQQLLKYVDGGGLLLITGPVSRDEHWKRVDRMSELGVHATVEPLIVRQSELKLPGEKAPVQVTFPGTVQQLPFEVLRFADGNSVEDVRHGKGKILWAQDPVELSEGYDAAAALYRYALGVAGVEPPFTELTPLSPGVLAFPTVLDDAVLYSFSCEALADQAVDLRDRISHAHIRFQLRSQHGAALLLRRSDGAVLAAYGDAAATTK